MFFFPDFKMLFLLTTDRCNQEIHKFVHTFSKYLKAYSGPDTVLLAELAELSNAQIQGNELWHKTEEFHLLVSLYGDFVFSFFHPIKKHKNS